MRLEDCGSDDPALGGIEVLGARMEAVLVYGWSGPMVVGVHSSAGMNQFLDS